MSTDTAFTKAYKRLVEKPGASVHSQKFDRCVEHVQSRGGAKNAYAICTAALGDAAFKSVSENDPSFVKELDVFLHKLGIAGAGPVPNSLLARQDLEGTEKVQKTLTKDCDEHLQELLDEAKDEAHELDEKVHAAEGETTTKGPVETTTRELHNIVDKIKDIQVRRQKATIAERSKESTGKSFKQVWSTLRGRNKN